MKLRIKGNSLRLRLAKGEVEQLVRTGIVEDTAEFGLSPEQQFVYAVSSSDIIDQPVATLENNAISVCLPKMLTQDWAESDQISIREEQVITGNKTLNILIEKDFACLKESAGEDDTDGYPNPLTVKTRRVMT